MQYEEASTQLSSLFDFKFAAVQPREIYECICKAMSGVLTGHSAAVRVIWIEWEMFYWVSKEVLIYVPAVIFRGGPQGQQTLNSAWHSLSALAPWPSIKPPYICQAQAPKSPPPQ